MMRQGRARLWASAILIVAWGAIAYSDSFRGPFIFDDYPSIIQNRSIRSLGAPGAVLNPPIQAATASGRPILNLSLAVNYSLGGLNPTGYHVLNLLFHLAAALTLFGVLRRTLIGARLRGRFGPAALPLALASALLWVVHPLTTEAVTYTIQRAESLASLFYLLTLYGFIRSTGEEGAGRVWSCASIAACLLGMGAKETVVSAPVLVLLYDRTFVAGSFREALRRHRLYYAGLAATWILLASLVLAGGGNRSGSIGFGVPHAGAYVLTQGRAIVHYLRLSLWPAPLALDYGTYWEGSALSAARWIVPVLALAAAAIVAAWRNSPWGFLGLWFFAILAPTSLMPGTTQMIVEHRMYLALAAVVVAVVVGLYAVLGWRTLWIWPLTAVLFAGLTFARNRDYRSVEAIWADTMNKRPEDAIAQYNFANAIDTDPARRGEAIAHFRQALRLRPDYPDAHDSLGFLLAEEPGGFAAALAEYREAVRENPIDPIARNNLGNALIDVPGSIPEAIEELQTAEELAPELPEIHKNLSRAHNNRGSALMNLPGRRPEAINEYRAATQADATNAFAHANLGSALAQTGAREEAITELRKAVALDPSLVGAHFNLGALLAKDRAKQGEAIEQLQIALRLQPDFEQARRLLARLRESE